MSSYESIEITNISLLASLLRAIGRLKNVCFLRNLGLRDASINRMYDSVEYIVILLHFDSVDNKLWINFFCYCSNYFEVLLSKPQHNSAKTYRKQLLRPTNSMTQLRASCVTELILVMFTYFDEFIVAIFVGVGTSDISRSGAVLNFRGFWGLVAIRIATKTILSVELRCVVYL